MMIKRFQRYIQEHKLFNQQDFILLAVSGGIDSVVLLELFYQAGYTFGIVHCNFHLRGEESDKDEQFVRLLAEKYKAPVYIKAFDTKTYAEENGISVQMAARNLRYCFFEEIMNQQAYSYTATAHHLNDAIETFFINLVRGTGISGLHGILPQNGKWIHPMLLFTRKEIHSFYEENRLRHREDQSNQSDKYKRNKIRHDLMPVLMQLQPEFEQIMSQNMDRLLGTEQMLKDFTAFYKEKLFRPVENTIQIGIKELKKLHPLKTYLYQLLKDYAFSETVIKNIVAAVNNEEECSSGKQFFSENYRLTIDREVLIIEPVENASLKEYTIQPNSKLIEHPVKLQFQIVPKDENFQIEKSPNIALLDYDMLKFPLVLKKWSRGDKFIPFGMKGKRVLLSDFFNNHKIPVPQKEKIWLLKSKEKIVWVVGMRIDERFCVTKSTQRVLKINLSAENT